MKARRRRYIRPGPLGEPCPDCGADEWYARARGNRCAPCERRRLTDQNRKWKQTNPAGYLWVTARYRASKSGLAFEITEEDVRAAWPADDCCPAFGEPLVFGGGNGLGRADSPSLDRIDSSRGYIPGNIRVISFLANHLLWDGVQSRQLRQLATWLDRQPQPEEPKRDRMNVKVEIELYDNFERNLFAGLVDAVDHYRDQTAVEKIRTAETPKTIHNNSPYPTHAELQTAMTAFANKHSLPVAKALLEEYANPPMLSKIPAEKLAEVYSRLTA